MPQITTRPRADLKTFFVKNAIPTESNFADLIDGMLNPQDDGIARLPNDALLIVAAGDATSQKKALHFYAAASDTDPSWTLSLNPRQTPADAATAKLGFSISDGAGNSRLFIERTTGRVGIGTVAPVSDLTLRRDAGGKLGPVITLMNAAGSTGAGGAIDFDGYDVGTTPPTARIQSQDDGNFSSHVVISTKNSGAAANALVERMRITSDGMLRFSNDAPKDKIVIYDNGGLDRYGLGLNGGNINLFCPQGARFSLRKSSSTGDEVFSVSGTGAATFTGPIVPKVGDNASSGIQFPTDPGGGGGDEAFLRYSFQPGTEITKLVLGINNDANDALILWQAGAARLTIANNQVSVANNLVVTGAVSWGESDTRTEVRDNAGLQGNAGARSGFYQTSAPVNFPAGASNWWHLLDVRHSNPANNYALQISGSFFDQNLWFRKTNNSANMDWHQFVSADAAGNASIKSTLTAGVYRLNDPTDGSKYFQMYYESGNDTVVFYHQSGAGMFLRQDGNWQHNSDESLKKNVLDLRGVLEKVTRLRPVSFDWKSNPLKGIGFVAQEVEPIFPELVSEHRDPGGRPLKGLPYASFGVLAIAAIKELKADYDARLEAMERKLAAQGRES